MASNSTDLDSSSSSLSDNVSNLSDDVSNLSDNASNLSDNVSNLSDEEIAEITTGCYLNEPEYSKEELSKLKNTKLKDNSHNSTNSTEECLDSSRLENLHWCTCHTCVIFDNFKLIECKCCKEFSTLLNEKLNDIHCITLHPDFEILCLNRTVLETACVRHRRYHRKFKELSKYKNK